MRPLFLIMTITTLSGCSAGNVHSASDYDAPPPPAVSHPDYDPYAPYGKANATWRAPVFDRRGSIVKPAEPLTQADRPDYEHAPWATGAAGGNASAPPGTF